MANNKLLLTYANSTASATAAQTISNANSYSVIFDEGRKSIWAQGKEYGYSSDTVTYASYVTTGTGKNLVAGTNVTLTNANGSVTISSTYTDTNTTNVSITNSGTAGTNNYVSAVTMTNSGNNENDHKLTITYSALPSLSVSGATATNAKYVNGITVNGHAISYTYASIPTLSGGAGAATGKYVSGVTVSGHAVTVTQENLPTLSVSGTTATNAKYINGITVNGHTISYTYANVVDNDNTNVKVSKGTALSTGFGGTSGTDYVTVSTYSAMGASAASSTGQTMTVVDATIPTYSYVSKMITDGMSVADALHYVGTVTPANTAEGSIALKKGTTTVETTYKGDVFKSTGTGYVGTQKVTAGDMIIANVDDASAQTPGTSWDVVQQNINFVATNSDSGTLTPGSSFVATGISITDSGAITVSRSKLPADSDEKVTDVANASKAYLLGHPMQASNDTAYSNAAVYMAGGYVYATSGSVASGTTTLVTGGTVNTAITTAIDALDASFSYTNTTTSFISYSLTETNGKVTAFTVNHDKLIDEINAKEAVTAAALNNINGYLNASVSSTSTASGITATLGGTVKAPTISLSGSTANTITYVKADTTAGTGVATGLTVTHSGTNPLTYTVQLSYTSLAVTSGTNSYNGTAHVAGAATTIPAVCSRVITNISQAANGKITYTYASLPENAFKDTTANESITFTASGDVTGTASGTTSLTPTLTIGDGKVTNAKLANSSITIVDKTVALGESMSPADFWGTL